MREIVCCPICESQSRNELVSFPRDPYLKRLPTRTDHTVHYVVCAGCGFVYQRQMMDESEMTQLYSSSYRSDQPDPDYLNANRVCALEVFSWIASKTGLSGRDRSVLDIGCATGMFLRPFVQQGWNAFGLDAGGEWIDYGKRAFGLDLRSEFFTRESFPGRQFDLILFSHVIEHVLDPAPVLEAIRQKLTDGGYLFIGTPNVLAPKRKLYPGLFGGDHVRLFSPRTLQAYLRRCGFRAVTIETHQPRGLRVLAMKADGPPTPDLREKDDWRAVHALYRGLFSPEKAVLLGRNLAALVEHHEPVLQEACRWQDTRQFHVHKTDEGIDNIGKERTDGSIAWLYGTEGSRARAQRCLSGRLMPEATNNFILLMGLGLGHLAELLEAQLPPSCQLLIWEADPCLFATALRCRDLSTLFRSPRVTLRVGSDVSFIRQIARERGTVRAVKVRDPIEASARHAFYEEFDVLLKIGSRQTEPSADPDSAETICARG